MISTVSPDVRLVLLVVDVADGPPADVLAVRGCLTSRGISTRRVLFILSLVTTPTSIRRRPRSAVVAGVARLIGPTWLLGWAAAAADRSAVQLALAEDRLDPGDLPLGLADLAGRLQPLGGRLEAEVEQVLARLLAASARAARRSSRGVRRASWLDLAASHPAIKCSAGGSTNRQRNGIL